MSKSLSILIIDDEPSVRDSLKLWLLEDGCNVDTAEDARSALKLIESNSYDIMLLDIKLPGMDGLELHRRIKAINENQIVIIMTAFASVDSAVQALKDGAYDYICKPFDPDTLSHLISKIAKHLELEQENVTLRERLSELEHIEEMVGDSPALMEVLDEIKVVAQTDSTVIITGESGTGKELVAHAIHLNSHRKFFPMITVHCGAVTESLLEDELFGHERGAFTGAQFPRKGKFELADGGTLFLDEISTISAKMQIELLRILETKQFSRVGGSREISSDFRILCATNLDLKSMVDSGHFREDLFYRLNVFNITVPPLRKRKEDIPGLVDYFMAKYARLMNRKLDGIESKAHGILRQYDFPGNVRELENIIERAIVVSKSGKIRPRDLPIESSTVNSGVESLEELERAHIQQVLTKYDWNRTHAAKALGIDRATLYNKIRKFDLKQSSPSRS